jgi:hypothetical protein
MQFTCLLSDHKSFPFPCFDCFVCLFTSLILFSFFSAEVMILDSSVVVYKVINDVIVYVLGTNQENELILQAVLQALDETIANLLK